MSSWTALKKNWKKAQLASARFQFKQEQPTAASFCQTDQSRKLTLTSTHLKTLSEIARKEYGLAGAVQHGASTLPPEAFHKFVECETAEVHLATEFQNMIYESKHFPADLKKKIYAWLKINAANEAKQAKPKTNSSTKHAKKG